MHKKLKNWLKPLINTPLHPQWLIRLGHKRNFQHLVSINSNSLVLDIGCFNKWPKKIISPSCLYYGLDYLETAENWYQSKPDLFASACNLPIQNNSINNILLLDVLEHIAETEQVINECYRVLKKDGELLMQIPFLYPLHDEPRDFIRLTEHGLKYLSEKCGFHVKICDAIGHPIETAVLLLNIALCKTILQWFNQKNPACFFIIVLPFFILTSNLIAKAIALMSTKNSFMPHSYQLILKKN
jgi:SAM-dependent methyltransferase